MLNIYPDNIQVNIIVPLTHEKTLTIFEWYFHDADSEKTRKRAAKAITFSDTVQAEDMHICEAVQRGLGSTTYGRGRQRRDHNRTACDRGSARAGLVE